MTGILLAEVVKHEHTSYLSFCHYVVWSLLLVSGVLLTFTGITILGLDPLWSLGLAKKWCAKSEWVHPDTTPFFAFVRDVSSLLGKFKYLFCSLKISAESAFLKRGKYQYKLEDFEIIYITWTSMVLLNNQQLPNVYHSRITNGLSKRVNILALKALFLVPILS